MIKVLTIDYSDGQVGELYTVREFVEANIDGFGLDELRTLNTMEIGETLEIPVHFGGLVYANRIA